MVAMLGRLKAGPMVDSMAGKKGHLRVEHSVGM